MPKLLKVAWSDFTYASRNKRELSVARELGYEVQVLTLGRADQAGKEAVIDGFNVLYASTKKPSSKYKNINRVLALLVYPRLAMEIRKLKPDVISGHDLKPLFASYLSTLFIFRSKRPKLVYDSHEFEIGRSASRSKMMTWLIMFMERFLIKRCVFSIMVSDSIADKVREVHRLKTRPIVARNIPPYWFIDDKVVEKKRRDFEREAGISEGKFLIMYHGGLQRNRGIESLIDVIVNVSDTFGVILGNAQDPKYLVELKKEVEEKGVANRIMFIPAVSIDVLWQYVGAADVGLIALTPVNKNHLFSQPNKLFENIQSLTPVIVSDFPDLRRIVMGHQIGLTCNPMDVRSVFSAVTKMRDDKELYKSFKASLVLAKEELCWENEKIKLKEAYGRLL